MKTHPILSLVLPLLLVPCACSDKPAAAPGGGATKSAATPGPAKAAAVLPNPDFTTDARGLYAEFRPSIEAGSAEVKQKYTGKTVRLSGEIKSNDVSLGNREITLKANDKMGQVFLTFAPEAKEKAGTVKAGDTITVQCVSTGWMIGPTMEKCQFVPTAGVAALPAAMATTPAPTAATTTATPTTMASAAPVASYGDGDAVQVLWKGDWWPAQVTKSEAGRWFIHYDGYGNEWDEWVGPDRIKK